MRESRSRSLSQEDNKFVMSSESKNRVRSASNEDPSKIARKSSSNGKGADDSMLSIFDFLQEVDEQAANPKKTTTTSKNPVSPRLKAKAEKFSFFDLFRSKSKNKPSTTPTTNQTNQKEEAKNNSGMIANLNASRKKKVDDKPYSSHSMSSVQFSTTMAPNIPASNSIHSAQLPSGSPPLSSSSPMSQSLSSIHSSVSPVPDIATLIDEDEDEVHIHLVLFISLVSR